jgi:hypothetical protein
LAVAVALVAAACGSASVRIEAPSAAAFDLPIDCGPITDRTECLVAVEVLEDVRPLEPGARAAIAGVGDTPTITVTNADGRTFSATLYRNPLGHWTVLELPSPS